jgi:hypothetical protein
MGRMIKNTVIRSGSHAAGIPVGTSSIGPDQPTVGQARWNTTTSRFEYYNGSVWQATAHEGAATIVKDQFSGNSVQTVFTFANALSSSYTYNYGQEAQVLVFVGQVYQNPGVAYTFNGSNKITFTAAPSTGNLNIQVLHNYPSTIAA